MQRLEGFQSAGAEPIPLHLDDSPLLYFYNSDSNDNTIQCWNMDTYKCVASFTLDDTVWTAVPKLLKTLSSDILLYMLVYLSQNPQRLDKTNSGMFGQVDDFTTSALLASCTGQIL